MPDQAPTTTSSGPDQLPDQQSQPANSGSLFAQAMQSSMQPATSTVDNQIPNPQPPPVSQNPVTGGPQINPGNGEPPKPLYHDKDTVDSSDPRDFHPAVQNASVLRKIALTLAGGPATKTTIDPTTGETTRTPVPLTSRQILLASVANVLGSAGQIASNLSNRMEGRAPNPIQPLATQQAQQKQDQLSEEDYNRRENAKVRQAKVLQANMESMRTAYALGKESDDIKNQYVATHSDELANANKAGNVLASDIPSDQIMKKGYDPSKYVTIPDGIAPVFTADGKRATHSNSVPLSQLTYSVVDGTTQAPLTQADYDKFRKYQLIKGNGDSFKLPEGATVTQATLNQMNHTVALIEQTARELQEVNPKVDLTAAIQKNPKLALDAIKQWNNDGASTEPDIQLDQVRGKHPQAAAFMQDLVGADSFQKYKEDRAAREATLKAQAAKTGELAAETSPQGKAAAQQKSDIAENARIGAEDRKQQAKDKSTMGYVEDQSGKTYYVSKYDAQNNPQYSAQSFNEVKPSDLSRDKQVIRPLSDVQMNINHYRTATNAYDAAVRYQRIPAAQVASDRDNLTTIFSAPAVTDAASAHAGAGGFGISVPTLSADLNAGLAKKVTAAYNSLSPEAKAMADNYVRARAAIPAWVKALTNSGRGSKEQLDIELQNLLPPYYKTDDVHNRLDGFQDNLNNQVGTLPQNLLGNAIPAAVTRGQSQPQANPQNVQPKPATQSFQKYSSDGKWGWNGSGWVSTGR